MIYLSQAGSNSGGGGGGSNIQTIDGDVGSVSGPIITLTGGTSGAVFTGVGTVMTESFNFLSLPATTATNGQIRINGNAVLHSFDPVSNTNIYVGINSGNFTNTLSTTNSAFGGNTLSSITTALGCTALGFGTLQNVTTGSNNTGIGVGSLINLVSGVGNICIDTGLIATGYTSSESNNILIGNAGIAGESNVIHIGTQGASTAQQNKCFIAGIQGVAVATPQFVQINPSTGQLGSTTAGAASIFTSIKRQVLTTSGTYTPSVGTLFADIECIGAGGGSGGCDVTTSTTVAAAGGGGGGGYARGIFSAATIGASQAFLIGAAGTAGAAGNTTGGTGGTTSIAGLGISAAGGHGGSGSPAASGAIVSGSSGGAGSGGDFQTTGMIGGSGFAVVTGTIAFALSGYGGSTFFGGGGSQTVNGASGQAGKSAGGGAGGSSNGLNSSTAQAGAAGFRGEIIITEYI